jgi:aminoglycoside phosphotransferase
MAPAPVAAFAAGRPLLAVWRNELGGLTFQVGFGSEREFVKWAPAGSGLDLAAEEERLRWLAAEAPGLAVPRVIVSGADVAGDWLATAGLPGDSAVATAWRSEPRTAVRAIGEGLRLLHDSLQAPRCPFSWSLEERRGRARAAAAAMGTSAADLDRLDDSPEPDVTVVCHGDACAPNTLLDANGAFAGHVDLGTLGAADRWADLAVAAWSTEWNYGPGWEGELLAAYGVQPDPDRQAYYRLLWDLCP